MGVGAEEGIRVASSQSCPPSFLFRPAQAQDTALGRRYRNTGTSAALGSSNTCLQHQQKSESGESQDPLSSTWLQSPYTGPVQGEGQMAVDINTDSNPMSSIRPLYMILQHETRCAARHYQVPKMAALTAGMLHVWSFPINGSICLTLGSCQNQLAPCSK